MMKKALLILTLSAVFLNPANVFACRYENISVDSDGTVRGRWIPCNDENCPDYQRHFQAIKNQNVHVTDVAPAKPVDRFATAKIKINEDGEVIEPAKEEQQEVTKEDEPKQEAEQEKENAGKVYDKKQHRERDVEAVNAEREAIDKVTGELPEQKQEEKKEPVEKKVIKEIGKIFGF